METPQVEVDKKKVQREEKKAWLEQIVKAAARYERLLNSKDYQDVVLDLQNVVDMHDKEIKGYLTMYTLTSSFFKKIRLAEVMGQHQMKREHIIEGINYVKMIVEKAKEARTGLEEIKQQEEKEKSNV